MIRIGALVSGVVFMTCIVERAFVAEAVSVDTIAQGIFVGQAYVSRNVYLKGFSDERRTDWPDGVVASRLRPPEEKGAAQRLELTFSHIVNASGSDEYSDFPIRERATGEDELHHPPDSSAQSWTPHWRIGTSASIGRNSQSPWVSRCSPGVRGCLWTSLTFAITASVVQ